MSAICRDLAKVTVPSTLSAIDGMEHVAVVRGLMMPGSAQTFEEVVAVIERVLAH